MTDKEINDFTIALNKQIDRLNNLFNSNKLYNL